MKHNHAFLRKEFSKIRDEITRNYVLSTLTKSDEELQQQKQMDPYKFSPFCQKLIDEILGVGSNPTRQEGENRQ